MSVGLIRAMTIALSTLAGFVDALGYLVLGGFYVAFMSGNSTILGISAGEGSGGRTGLALGLVFSFTLGVVMGTLLGRQFGARRPVAVLLLVASLLALAGALHGAVGADGAGLMMALAMGAENTVFAKEGQSGIGLTYMTGTLVRLGQRFAEALTGGPWGALGPDALLWSGMVVGALLGALVFGAVGLTGLFVAAGAALVMAGVAAGVTAGVRTG